jgi:GNAT superfamily N-acetyltransferase
MIATALPQLKFRLAENTPDDSRQFCRLSNSLYARPVDAAYYSWQFFQTPFPSLTIVVVTAEGELCGSYTLHIQPALPDSVNVAWALDIMVSPAYQRRGILRRLTEYATELVRPYNPVALCVMANEKADKACVDGLGWQRINIFNTWSLTQNRVNEQNQTLSYKPVEDFAACGELLDGQLYAVNSAGEPLFGNRRSAAYLNWRFVQNPRYRYARFLAESSDGAFGYLVLKIFCDPVSQKSYGDIVDMYWREDEVDALRDMLLFAVRWFQQAGVEEIALWLQTNTVLDQVGRALGFTPRPQPRYFCCHVLDTRYDWLSDSACWFLTMADSEVY